MRRARYQQGCLIREKRKLGPDAWVFLWREINSKGVRQQRKHKIGTVAQYPTEAAAQRALEPFRVRVNSEQPAMVQMTVSTLAAHYWQEEGGKNAYSTQQGYKSYLNSWILPRWGEVKLYDVKTIAVESWLSQLQVACGETTKPMARGTKAKIRNIMSALFNHAIRHELLPKGNNPIRLVRQSAKRERIPETLTAEELQSLFLELGQRERTLVLLDVPTGMRVGELLGGQWRDVDFEGKAFKISRSVWHQHIGPVKTEESEKVMPLSDEMVADLKAWREFTAYPADSDWIFASPVMKGNQPLWPENLIKQIRKAAKRAGIVKHLSWHVFRHTFATLLAQNNEDVKTVQALMRHANSRVTMDVYTHAVSDKKRAAQGKVVGMITPLSLPSVTVQ